MRQDIYDKMYQVEDAHWWFAAKRKIVNDLLERFLLSKMERRPLRLADLGCGCGRMLAELPESIDGVGLDASQRAIEFCAARGVGARLGRLPDDVPFAARSFDAVLMLDVVEHLDDDAASLASAGGLIRPGGVMIITVPAIPGLWSDWDEAHEHKRRYTRASFERAIAASGLEVEFVSYMNMLLFPIAAAARLFMRSRGRPAQAQLETPRAPVNAVLRSVFASERFLLGRVPLPVGLSLVAVLKKAGIDGASAPQE
jgi:SAM-dependent methyltransferase